MPHLHRLISVPLLAFSHSSIDKQNTSIFTPGSRSSDVNELLALKGIRRNETLWAVTAVEKDSEFEIDPEQAREALRKLDEQLQSLSKKQVDPRKIRALDLKQQKPPLLKEEAPDLISGSFLASLATALFVFTIVYNVIFLTVIKPSIDGPAEPISTSIDIENSQVDQSQQSLIIPQIPVLP